MARYIDADEAYELLNGIISDFDNSDLSESEREIACGTLGVAQEKIENIPAADVRPERYGGWLYSEDGIWECSECGAGSRSPTNPFCWKCGAKMDGDKINGQKDT